MVILKLSIDRSMRQLLDLVAALKVTTLDLLEVPCHQELPCGCHNASLLNLVSVVEPGWCKIDELYLILDDVLGINGQLEYLWLGLNDRLGEARSSLFVLSGDHEDISLASGQNPQLVLTNVDCPDWLSQTWEQSLRNLTHLLVHPDVTIGRADYETAVDVGADSVEHNVCLIGLRRHDAVITNSGVNLMHALCLDAEECAGYVLLPILGFIAKLVEIDFFLARLDLLDNLT